MSRNLVHLMLILKLQTTFSLFSCQHCTFYNWLSIPSFSHQITTLLICISAEYLYDQPYAPLPVLLNDVVFAAHALIFSLVYSFQAMIYERGSQRLHPVLWIGGVIFIFASVSLFGLSFINLISLLQLANLFSYVKIVCMTPMYLPQLYFNYTRKSTSGFAIETIMLDFSGGVLSLMQMVFQAWNVDDWSGFVGNPVKFGLALLTMILDMGFFIQHFCLYRNQRDETIKA